MVLSYFSDDVGHITNIHTSCDDHLVDDGGADDTARCDDLLRRMTLRDDGRADDRGADDTGGDELKGCLINFAT